MRQCQRRRDRQTDVRGNGSACIEYVESIEENEVSARLHCTIQVFASLAAVTDFEMPAELCNRRFEMIETGFFSTEYLRLLCVIALPKIRIKFAQWSIDDLRQRLIANAIPQNKEASRSYIYEFVFYTGEPDIPMPIEQDMDTIEGFVRESNS
jgi:hypothetical protein